MLKILQDRELATKDSSYKIKYYYKKNLKNRPLYNPYNWINYNIDIKNRSNYSGPCLNCKNINNFTLIKDSNNLLRRFDNYFCSYGCSYSYNLYK